MESMSFFFRGSKIVQIEVIQMFELKQHPNKHVVKGTI